ncbi:MAG: protein-L-isoaspartate(D-aspartate) O-methyltransferase [Sandaracinaceae bacterium]|jgi:protein-L-isoaspartate(D-aspartate) O-methyltransferase|nr:protein-L-isoaspartate(D-aspartate) O-methyltransferase [Sandaracinaceae bacterium]
MNDVHSISSRRAERDAMIREQLEARGLSDDRVFQAMREVPREDFVPDDAREDAYADKSHPLALGQTISQPYMVALSSSVARIKPTDRVLEIGTGSGYQAAVLSRLAKEVITVERLAPLAAKARATLAQRGIHNVTVLEGDGTMGAADYAPFDAIVVTAGGPSVPASLVDQLAVGGRLVIPVGPRDVQELVLIEKTGPNTTRESNHGRCVYVPLIGAEGWTSS